MKPVHQQIKQRAKKSGVISSDKRLSRKEIIELARLVDQEKLDPEHLHDITEFGAAQGLSKKKNKELADSPTEKFPWIPAFQKVPGRSEPCLK